MPILISSTSRVEVLMIVSVPLTVRFPSTTTSRPNVVIPEIFESPTTERAQPGTVLPIPTPSTVATKIEPLFNPTSRVHF